MGASISQNCFVGRQSGPFDKTVQIKPNSHKIRQYNRRAHRSLCFPEEVFMSVSSTSADWTGRSLTRSCSALLSHLWNAESTFLPYRPQSEKTHATHELQPPQVARTDLWTRPGRWMALIKLRTSHCLKAFLLGITGSKVIFKPPGVM